MTKFWLGGNGRRRKMTLSNYTCLFAVSIRMAGVPSKFNSFFITPPYKSYDVYSMQCSKPKTFIVSSSCLVYGGL